MARRNAGTAQLEAAVAAWAKKHRRNPKAASAATIHAFGDNPMGAVVQGVVEVHDEHSGVGDTVNSPSEGTLFAFAYAANRGKEIYYRGYSISRKKGELPLITIHSPQSMWYKALIEPVSGLAVEVPGTFRFGNLTVTVPEELMGIAPEFTWFWRVAEYVPTPTNLSFHPRRDVRKVFDRDHTGEPFPGEWAFRAYATEDGKTIRVFVDHAETPESLKWIVLHEIGHVIVSANPALRKVYRSQPKPLNYATNDDAHDAWPEEIACNDMADRLAPLPGLNRKWWRRRVGVR